MLRFNKLRLTGFKSFVDATDLFITQGLTGVVGPNGCGKSNLVEALRWAMGETSAKQMRGSDMDDVIFGGTSNRPARNIAEVVLSLDNAERTAPAQFNDFTELEVSRRIERERGSTYRVNGKEVRARDVQLLFADSSTGARSTAMVSQGRIGAVINAKPAQRRMLLEEAAGITGLHSRRHEAELRLRGAEGNLERLDDILVTLDVQMGSLRKQARQASRYRNLSDHIRKAEATFYFLRWTNALESLDRSRGHFKEAEAKVNDLTRLAGAASAKQAESASGLPELRKGEAEAAAELQRLVLARESLDAEERRVAEQKRDGEVRLQQVEADGEREKSLAADARAATTRLDEERAGIEAARQGEEASQGAAGTALEEANAAVRALEEQLSALTQQVASDEARRGALERSLEEAQGRVGRLSARAEEMAAQRAALEAEAGDVRALDAAETDLDAAAATLEDARQRAEQAEQDRLRATDVAAEAATKAQEARAAFTAVEAEEKALAKLVEAGKTDLFPPLIDALTVKPGFEAALGAAFGEDLDAPADEPAEVHWRTLPPYASQPALPGGATPLSELVTAPPALARRLGQIGVVEGEEDGRRLAAELQQGQRLVSRTGGLWRWDGFTIAAGAPTPAAIRLEQRNRLAEVRGKLDAARAQAETAEAAAADARAAGNAATDAERAAREAVREADRAFARARDAQSTLKEQAARQSSRLAALVESAEGLDQELSAAKAQVAEAAEALAALPDTAETRAEADRIRGQLGERRAVQVDRQAAYNNLMREAEARRHRLDSIDAELRSWVERRDGASERLDQLSQRRAAVLDELERLASRPAEIAAQRDALVDTIEAAEVKRKAAADRLAESETLLRDVEQGLRAAEHELGRAREEMVRAEGAVAQGKQACRDIAERIAEKLDCRPDDTREIAGLAEDDDLPDLEAVEKRLERLQRERETMGPVNLRAEQEMQELDEQITTLRTEREDLIQAIEKLRQGINELNREGRERLLASFKEVDAHFQELFVRLFGGGRAHLTLTESDDPLEAGLEIMASPPGKRLQMLSLLSGGEQALTALALLFGVFMTNPAPICVLDEVDAPLDDANVDRFCTLLSEISQTGQTRFLVITHHRMTMARMDRLFGVTMAERGVSQLVSVDLKEAERLRDAG